MHPYGPPEGLGAGAQAFQNCQLCSVGGPRIAKNVRRKDLALKLVGVSHLPDRPGAELTEREQEVLAAVAQGLSNKEIAEKLTISTNTVRSHISSILAKLNLSNRTQLALYAVEERSDRE